MGLDVLLVARPGTTQHHIYAVDLVLEGNRLLVDTWAPARRSPGRRRPRTRRRRPRRPSRPSRRGKLDSRWLLISRCLALALLVPLGFLARSAIRNRRAYRRYSSDSR